MITGYFARPAIVGKQSSRWTKTHRLHLNKVLCGYKPHKTMKFQWCGDIKAECNKCNSKTEDK